MRYRTRRHSVENDNVHRWLVSYADYMTLLFALFVVLYAMAMVKEKSYESVTESLGRIFQADTDLPKNLGHGDDILLVNSSKTNKPLFGQDILDVAGPELVDGDVTLSNISDNEVGTNLTSIEEQLNTALFDIIESGFAQLQIDGDWLEIELSSGLLFPSGSSSSTPSAKAILTVINNVISKSSNYIRIRGYTDNEPINTELFSSNWELSVYRATAILHLFEELKMDPARMAIEGYGEYYPSANNATADGRAKNRKVVIAISKYGIETSTVKEPKINVEDVEAIKPLIDKGVKKTKIRTIQLENGGIRITTRDQDQEQPKDNK